jgi:Na+-transporting NADH:ubiquinone oxidoreductase subunit C
VHSNKYTFIYATGFTALVALVLAVAATSLYPLQKINQDQATRKAILQSVMEVNEETLEADYNRVITEIVVNSKGEEMTGARAFDINVLKESKKPDEERLLPIFVYKDASRTNYILPMQGSGLWGPISAFLALEEDATTVYGVVFDHVSETPGLGAEITTDRFQDQYKGKKIADASGTFAAISVLKGSGHDVSGQPSVVDGISGATMTSNGVTNMFRDELKNYSLYFKKIKS